MEKSIKVCVLAMAGLLAADCPAQAGNNSGHAFTIWPDTGQTKCYDNSVEIPCPAVGAAFHGQDAQHNAPTHSYTNLGNGMIQDSVTGLIWEQKTNKDGSTNDSDPHDADNTYTWCDTNPDTNRGNEGLCGDGDSMDFLAALNGANFGGHNDWRLPTIKELATLANLEHQNPAVDPIFSATTQSGNYWSSTSDASTSSAWRIDFDYGDDEPWSKSGPAYLRAVRGGQSTQTMYVDNGDTVTDTVTGLEWQKNIPPANYTWQEALAYCENLTLNGKTDWRLPDRNELRSIVDYSRSSPAIDPVFTTLFSLYSWSSTTSIHNTANAWLINFVGGADVVGVKWLPYNVRAVRSSQPVPLQHLVLSTSEKCSGEVGGSPVGIYCGPNCAGYALGSTVTLTVKTNPGSTFIGWSGDSDCADGIVVMNSSVNCLANFIGTSECEKFPWTMFLPAISGGK